MDMAQLDPATTQALAWVFGSLLFIVLSTATGLLIKILGVLMKSNTQHELRIANLEDDMDEVHDVIFPIPPMSKRRKK